MNLIGAYSRGHKQTFVIELSVYASVGVTYVSVTKKKKLKVCREQTAPSMIVDWKLIDKKRNFFF